MNKPDSLPMLFARIHVLAPEARVLLVAAARSDIDTEPVARGLQAAIQSAGQTARVVEAGGEAQTENGYTVVMGRGILDGPQTLLSAAAADAIVLVARRGRTTRADLEAARLQIESAGGSLVGSVLLP